MGLDIENGALGAEYEQIKKVRFFQIITDSTVYRKWIQNITMLWMHIRRIRPQTNRCMHSELRK